MDEPDDRWLLNRRQLLAVSGVGALAGCTEFTGSGDSTESPYGFNNGLKIGEVRPRSAVVWTRLSRDAPTTWATRNLWYPPAAGTVEMLVWPADDPTDVRWFERRTTLDQDATAQFRLTDLEPDTVYRVVLRGAPDADDDPVELTGGFSTAPDDTTPSAVSFAVVSCQAWRFRDAGEAGFRTYRTLDEWDPDFFVHTGDIVYYDQGYLRGRSVPTARTHWHRTYSLDFLRAFHNDTPSYFLKDDHDIIDDDCWPGQRYGDLTFEDGVAVFEEQNPTGEVPYRTVRWGEDLQIWLLEMREFRSPNTVPDGPDKTILGERQIRWLQETIDRSDAAFRVVISPSIFVGPDRQNKNDNYANEGFRTESRMLREFLADRGVVVLGGDRHWQYASVDAETGLWEFGCGALAKGREGGWRSGDVRDEHRFLAVRPGFLWATVERENGEPVLTVEHRSRRGRLRHSEQFTANPVEHRQSTGVSG